MKKVVITLFIFQVLSSSFASAEELDTDGDGLTDAYEIQYGLDSLVANDLEIDADNDGLDLLAESILGTNPFLGDSDLDGTSDFYDSDPLTVDTRAYIKLDSNGFALSGSASDWTCVLELNTRLVWEVKTNDGGIHDKDNLYRWGGIGAEQVGSEFYDDWNELISRSNSAHFCGGSDWYVPSIIELRSLVDSSKILPSVDSQYFPNTPSQAFWSSSANTNLPSYAWYINFASGIDCVCFRRFDLRVRLVRSDLSIFDLLSFGSDTDGDGVADDRDAFPLDATESVDTDGNEIGDNADPDDDGDGIQDVDDLYPLDSTNTPIITSRLKNIATRGFIGADDNVLIGGLVINGATPKTVIIRAKGPSLLQAGLPGAMSDPQMTLFSGATIIDGNDDFQDHDSAHMIPIELIPSDSRESVIVATLAPGAYTAIVSGVNSEEGIGLIEVFELEDTGETRLINIGTRGYVGTGDKVLIGGLVIAGSGTHKIVIRAKGPSLVEQGVSGALENPQMYLFSDALIIDSNDDWQSHVRAGDIPDDLKPNNELEATIYTELAPGAYTVIVEGVGQTSGIGIVEVFEVM
jgi:hypothetical protein